MPDLHGWISEKVDEREALARQASRNGGDWTVDLPMGEIRADGGYAVAETGGTWAWHIAANDPAAVLRRCAADRKILARHCADPELNDWSNTPYFCQGCGCDPYSDHVTENINDCPELLDLAWAHGMSAAVIATLDRPQPPERPSAPRRPIPTSAVPAALRGPNWKPRP